MESKISAAAEPVPSPPAHEAPAATARAAAVAWPMSSHAGTCAAAAVSPLS